MQELTTARDKDGKAVFIRPENQPPDIQEAIKELARRPTGLGYFGYWVFGMTPARHHWLQIALIQASHAGLLENEGRTFRNLIFSAPPNSGKSTWATVWQTLWLIGLNPQINLLMLAATADIAEKFASKIGETIEVSQRWREVFPKVVPGNLWTKSDFTVARQYNASPDATLMARGMRGSIISTRTDGVIADDVYTYDIAKSAKGRSDATDLWNSTVDTRQQPNSFTHFMQTRWDYRDLYSYLMESGDYVVCDIKALYKDKAVSATVKFPKQELDRQGRVQFDEYEVPLHNDGPSYWPERWSAEHLVNIKHKLRRWFPTMYQGEPTSNDTALIPDEYIGWYTPEMLPPLPMLVQAWDTASVETGDETGFTCLGFNPPTGFWVLESAGIHPDIMALIEAIKAKFIKWNRPGQSIVGKVVVERASSGLQTEQVFKQHIETGNQYGRGMQLPYIAANPHVGSKEERAELIKPYIEPNGGTPRLWLAKGSHEHEALYDEIRSFPRGRSDNRFDSLVWAIWYAVNSQQMVKARLG